MDIEKERGYMCENCKTLYKEKKDVEECLKWCKENSEPNPLLEYKRYDDCELACSKDHKCKKTKECECLVNEEKNKDR